MTLQHKFLPVEELAGRDLVRHYVERLGGLDVSKRIRKLWLRAGAALGIVVAGGLAYHLLTAGHAMTAANAEVAVDVQTVMPRTMRLWTSFSGRMNAVDFAQIRPEVSGRITEIRFTDGQSVKAGDVLLVIDPAPYAAAVSKAEADLASARNNLTLASIEFQRAKTLVSDKWIAKSAFDQRATAKDVAEASVKGAEAALAAARIDLDRAFVKAPITGRASRPEITQGNLVQAGAAAPVLTSIVSDNGIYADFDVDEQTYLRNVRAHAATVDQEKAVPVELTMQGGADRVYAGTIYSFDNHIDTGSGTIRARARFQNEDGSLVPGMFVSVKLGSSELEPVLLVPERAVSTDQDKKFVYVVDADCKVSFREVSLGESVDGARIVRAGLHPGERVIVDGLQQVRPDMKVETREALADKPIRQALN